MSLQWFMVSLSGHLNIHTALLRIVTRPPPAFYINDSWVIFSEQLQIVCEVLIAFYRLPSAWWPWQLARRHKYMTSLQGGPVKWGTLWRTWHFESVICKGWRGVGRGWGEAREGGEEEENRNLSSINWAFKSHFSQEHCHFFLVVRSSINSGRCSERGAKS